MRDIFLGDTLSGSKAAIGNIHEYVEWYESMDCLNNQNHFDSSEQFSTIRAILIIKVVFDD